MASDIIPETDQGSKADILVQQARQTVKMLERRIDRLAEQGVLNASYGFKKNQPNDPMYCYVRQDDGSCRYVHVGVNKDKQRETISKINRFKKQQKLVTAKVKLENRIIDILGHQSMTLDICRLMLTHLHK